MNEIIRIGYWKQRLNEKSDLPYPTSFIDLDWDEKERKAIIDYLDNGEIVARWRGWSNCRICNRMNGSVCKGDGVYQWPEGYSHYIKEHNVKPPQDFISHVLKMEKS